MAPATITANGRVRSISGSSSIAGARRVLSNWFEYNLRTSETPVFRFPHARAFGDLLSPARNQAIQASSYNLD